jgi:alkanesulfonate monooxygenase SsuD/methylene tetrahydromethanopterin reductase-like flavin-dependent oxidoreductase (luciferase family)
MDFGAFILFQRLDESVATKDVYRHSLDLVCRAEGLGFSTAWFPEHHLIHYVSCPSPLMMTVAAAARTSKIRLGTAIAVAPYYHPIRLAGEIAQADTLTGGRLEIGIGRGAVNYEFARFGVDSKLASARFFESASVVKRFLSEEEVEHQGEFWNFPASTTVPRPAQTPFPRMWVAARSIDTIRWSISNGFNVMTNVGWGEPFTVIEQVAQQVKAAIREINPPVRPKFGVSRVCFVAETDALAREAMRAAQVSSRIFSRLFRDQVEVRNGFPVPEPLEGEASAEHLSETLIVGSPATCIEKLKRYKEIGVDHFMMFVFGPDLASMKRSMELFGTEVMPHFSDTK